MATETRKVLFQSRPAATTLTDAYTVAAATQVVVSSIIIANTAAATDTFRISIAVAGAANANSQYIAYDVGIGANATTSFTIGATLGATDKVRVYSTNGTLTFSGFGVEIT